MSREDELLEKLNECENATSFLQVSNKIINLKLKALLPKVFVQDDLVKEYAVDPLLKEDGPLATTDVVSKLMFAMGKISLETYADIGLYDQVLEYVVSQPEKVEFADDVIYDFIKNQAVLSSQQDSFYLESINQLKFSSFESFSQMRYESLIKTVLKLSCEMLIERIEGEINQ
ncbi:MltR family transcriptional regulator [Vibrio parahaemolyticus]|uniref:MltR family transcriptional regulator n=1 Tax=Vibrio parahaemolyticus TaxID=670 RepID=UPI001A320242|nr:MltR family transcriptional regulator [Vibrio parahaemolyticus]EGR0399080.1 transcriptional regulator [Vibrio parahaemolyticus]EGR0400589.1 transcriptional regulator [Vibrio parahaemolyticus]MCI9718030.1 transcriptional regulator [Vibrio parahaemolyticus]HAS6431369.1 transcriptional regulator [Vibrio parahaemolyticus]HAS6853450.1 transcriptional regulator [Vibrio parahaemolyticus]